ncbi:MAG: hypothetical protein J0665_00575 [Deltaproteobacteria bacterium]|jgi:nucleoside permease NupC|nr:hypothetical protein [Deltaproteobacteria bacterium]
MPEQLLRGIMGVAALLAIAVFCSRNRRLIQWKPVLTGVAFKHSIRPPHPAHIRRQSCL